MPPARVEAPVLAVETKRLAKTYRLGSADVPVLRGIDLAVKKGEFVSLMGPSGSGKSTLLNLVGLLDTPTAGGVRLMGRDTRKLDAKGRALARRDLLGFIFQSFNLLPGATALENVALPMTFAGIPGRKRKQKAVALLTEIGLGERLHHRPTELSGGERQRVAIARALALDPPILLADEPTGNLDSHTRREVMAIFQRLRDAGKTVVQVTHDEEMARFGDRIVGILDGRLVDGWSRPEPALVPPQDDAPTGTPQLAETRLKRMGVRA